MMDNTATDEVGALEASDPAMDAGSARSEILRAFYRRYAKRSLDIALVLLAAPIVLPLVVALALLVMSDGGKPFYAQARLGAGGRVFRLWKLRSMVEDADARLAGLLATDAAARAEWADTQKLKNDPRITPIGRVIRKTSLDEIPQLWNVLRGDMSLVGPRPMLPEQACLYPGNSYYEHRPGLTGLWQISDRNGSSFAARAIFDNRYHRQVSLATDLRVMLMTPVVVLRGTGY